MNLIKEALMKATTEQHIKFKRLQMKLGGLPLWQAKGLLESIWNLCATSTPCGNIGKFSNEDICASIEWHDDPDHLINTLVECGWLDECIENRLVVHNWNLHCPTYIKGNLAKHNKVFSIAKQPTKQPAKQPTNEGTKDGANSTVLPSQAKPSQVNPEENIIEQARLVIDILNETTGKSFRYTRSHLDKIKARFKEGYSLDDFRTVINIKNDQWGNDPKNKKYLRPETLFSPKFDGYLNEGTEAHDPFAGCLNV
jgi:uncharacterized phage protein (TIGR02220 family)